MAKAYRILTYEGSEQWLNETLENSSIAEQGVMKFQNGHIVSETVKLDLPTEPNPLEWISLDQHNEEIHQYQSDLRYANERRDKLIDENKLLKAQLDALKLDFGLQEQEIVKWQNEAARQANTNPEPRRTFYVEKVESGKLEHAQTKGGYWLTTLTHRCDYCGTAVYQKDKYCRSCGGKFL